MLRVAGMNGSTEHEALSMPCKRIGHDWVDLVFSSFFIVNFIQMYQINSAATSFVTKMTKRTENYFAIQQFWSFRQGQSKVEGLVLSKWIQTVVEKPIRKIQDQESVSPTFYFTLYCVDLASPHVTQGT